MFSNLQLYYLNQMGIRPWVLSETTSAKGLQLIENIRQYLQLPPEDTSWQSQVFTHSKPDEIVRNPRLKKALFQKLSELPHQPEFPRHRPRDSEI